MLDMGQTEQSRGMQLGRHELQGRVLAVGTDVGATRFSRYAKQLQLEEV